MTAPDPRTTRRRTHATVVAAWVVATIGALWLGAGLSAAQTDEDLSFLPAGSSSAAFLEQHERDQRDGPPRETATVVVQGAGVLGPPDLDALDELSATISGEPGLPAVATGPPVVSPDGRVAVLEVELQVDDDEVGGAVSRLREVGARWASTSAYEVLVTGEAGVDADLAAGDVDLWLLLCSAAVVAVVLAAVYRSPVLWLLPVGVGLVAVLVSRAALVVLAEVSVPVTELTASIGTVVVFGLSTDYALLLLHRLRNAAGRDGDERLARARREVRTPVLVSAGTIVLAVLALTPSGVPAISGLGPALAVGVLSAAVVSLTLLPALLGLLGVPVPPRGNGAGAWSRLASSVVTRPVEAAGCAAGALVALACLVALWDASADPLANVPDQAESKRGAEVVRDHFGDGMTAPLVVSFSADAARSAPAALEARARRAGVGLVTIDQEEVGSRLEVSLALETPPFTDAWRSDAEVVGELAAEIDEGALVGGSTAEAVDREAAVTTQLAVLTPLLLVALLVALTVWLRSLLASVVVVLSACLSAAAAVGATAVAMPVLAGSGESSAEVLLFGVLFLVAFGVDYLVFLVDGVRRSGPGPHPQRVADGLASTGPVISSAGLVLASTFAVLLFVPEANVRQVGLLVAVGVLVDTLVVRTFLVPPLLSWIGDRWARARDRGETRPVRPVAGPLSSRA
ncbi:MMPL family transporter [Nocardioides sp.]|uniref:MMPL family transporter n=1 Tax=Nocardioides sp. TaxID=35761 RepID=UPI001A321D90|nr:MMPL family transporter [Nocardioides sp.]MBJ7355919.1 MMPL family transporter [Nocardioides sp.]